eukprot:2433220-Rhodomonas_salina.1
MAPSDLASLSLSIMFLTTETVGNTIVSDADKTTFNTAGSFCDDKSIGTCLLEPIGIFEDGPAVPPFFLDPPAEYPGMSHTRVGTYPGIRTPGTLVNCTGAISDCTSYAVARVDTNLRITIGIMLFQFQATVAFPIGTREANCLITRVPGTR